MKFTLITPTGLVYTFFLRVVAEQYQLAYGGTIVTNAVFAQPVTP